MAGIAAIRYQASSFDTRIRMMGRQRAGETFLKAWIDHAGADPLTSWTDTEVERDAFAAHARALGATMPIAAAGPANARAAREAGALLVGDPSLPEGAWTRRWFGQDAWSLIGITHTISSHAALDRIAGMLTAPVQRWDALICTSHAVRGAVRAVLDAEADYLADRLGARNCTGPELPVIPLGIRCAEMAHDPAARTRWRAELGLGEDDVAVLQFGRIALHAKAHPLPLYRALAAAGARTGRRLHLIMAGAFINAMQEPLYRQFAAAFADSVATHFVDGARADVGGVRSAADIGTLLSDNIQESFGLAPVELMAAGLPVVASDWDGLRDTVEHGVTGFRIDTLMPPPGAGEMIARRHALGVDINDSFIGATAQATVVDIAAAADAFAKLAGDPELRRTMGEAGRERARRLHDWPVVIAAYRALIDELGAMRRAGTGERARPRPGGPVIPARMDPFANFAAHASAPIDGAMRLALAPGAPLRIADSPGGARPVLLVPSLLPPVPVLEAMIARVAGGTVTVAELIAAFPDTDRRLLVSGVAWLLKFGFLARA